MATKVVCPVCWTWADLGSRTTCKRFRAPLVFGDGRRIDEVAALTGVAPGSPIAEGAYAAATPEWTRDRTAVAAPPRTTDWVAVARWLTVGYGTLLVAAMLVAGLFLQHVTVTALDARSGQPLTQTLNLGPIFIIAAAVLAVVWALFAWLIQFAAARVALLLLIVLAIGGSVTHLDALIQPGGAGVAGAASLLIDVVYAAVLALSIVAAPAASRV